MEIPYTGYVEGMGYAFEEKICIDKSLYKQSGNSWGHLCSLQRIDTSPEAYVRSLNLTEEHIKKAICFPNMDGTFSVNMGPAKFGNKILKVANLDNVKVLFNYDYTPATLTVKVTECQNDNYINEEYTIPLKDFDVYYETQLTSDILRTFDLVNSSIGTPIGWLESKWNIENTANRRFRRDLSNSISKSLRNNGYKIKASTINKNLGKIANKIGRTGTALSAASILINIANNGTLKVSDVYTVVTGLCATIPGVGWAIGGVFFAADIMGIILFEKTIGDMIDDELEGGVLLGNDYEVESIREIKPFKRPETCLDDWNFIAPQDNTRVVLPSITKKWYDN